MAAATSSGLGAAPHRGAGRLAGLVGGLAAGRDPARRDRVGGDAVAGVVDGQGPGEAEHAGLRRGVRRLPAHRHHRAGHRRDHDDPAPPGGLHAGQHRPGGEERGVEVAGAAVRHCRGHARDRAGLGRRRRRRCRGRGGDAGHAGVVDQHGRAVRACGSPRRRRRRPGPRRSGRRPRRRARHAGLGQLGGAFVDAVGGRRDGTAAPRAPSRRAVAIPMPSGEPAPVTSATLPLRSKAPGRIRVVLTTCPAARTGSWRSRRGSPRLRAAPGRR